MVNDPSTLEENEANTFPSNAYFVFSTQSGSWQEFADLIDLEESGDIADLVSVVTHHKILPDVGCLLLVCGSDLR